MKLFGYIFTMSLLFLFSCTGNNFPDECPGGKGMSLINQNYELFYECNGAVYYEHQQSILSPEVNKIDYDFVTEDLENFEIINDGAGKDKDYVYLRCYENNKNVKFNKDTVTFESIDQDFTMNSFYKDKNDVYYYRDCDLLKIKNVDYDTFEIISNQYSKDKNSTFQNWFYNDDIKQIGFLFFKIKYVNLPIVEGISSEEISEKQFSSDIDSDNRPILGLEDFDKSKYKITVLGNSSIEYGANIYLFEDGNTKKLIYIGNGIRQYESDKMRIVSYSGFNLGEAPNGYNLDNIVFKSEFFVSEDEYYYIIDDILFYNGKVIGVVDTNTFRPFETDYYTKSKKLRDVFLDKNFVYDKGVKVGSSKNFEHVDVHYYKNNDFVFFANHKEPLTKFNPGYIDAKKFHKREDGLYSDGGKYKFDFKGEVAHTQKELQELRDHMFGIENYR